MNTYAYVDDGEKGSRKKTKRLMMDERDLLKMAEQLAERGAFIPL